MHDLATVIAVKVILPAIGVLGFATAAAEAGQSGLDVGVQEVSLGVLALFMLERTLAFVRWLVEWRGGTKAGVETMAEPKVPTVIVDHMRRQTDALECIREQLQGLKAICPLNDVAGHRELVEAVGREVNRQVDA